jgi:cytochrome c oxidase assembly factor CtaG
VKEVNLETSWQSLITEWDIPVGVTCTLAAVGVIYVRGWLALRRTRPATLPVWRLVVFLSGLLALFVAVSSPLDTFSEALLFMHMAQHFVLMLVAPPLIVLGCPFVPMLRGLPRALPRRIGGPLFRSRRLHQTRHFLSRLPIAWLAMNLTYVGWHIPRAYEFALSSERWHNFEHLCFFLTSVLFWWPIVLPWPTRCKFDKWMIIPYLLTSDLVNTGLSAFLCFSGRLLYPSYALEERPLGIDALNDQIGAGAFMWVFGSLVFVVPAIYLTVDILMGSRRVGTKAELERVRALAQ